VSVPLLLEQIFLAVHAGFPVSTFFLGLLWSQFLVLFCVVLPVVALAAMTSGLAAFLSFAMLPLTLALINKPDVMMLFGHWQAAQAATQFGPVEWVRSSIALVGAGLLSCFAIYSQYHGRRTSINRGVAVCTGGIVALAYLGFPWEAALKVQSWLSQHTFDAAALTMRLDATKKGRFPDQGMLRPKGVKVILPFSISGLPKNLEATADAVFIEIQGADGKTWKSYFARAVHKSEGSGETLLRSFLLIDPDFYHRESARPVSIRAKLHLTLLGEARSGTIPVQADGVNTLEGLRCGLGSYDQLYCVSAFRWPAREISASFGSRGAEPFTGDYSYSPFPAVMAFSPLESHWVSTPLNASTATIIAKEPLSHFEREFEVRDVHLDAFLNSPPVPGK